MNQTCYTLSNEIHAGETKVNWSDPVWETLDPDPTSTANTQTQRQNYPAANLSDEWDNNAKIASDPRSGARFDSKTIILAGIDSSIWGEEKPVPDPVRGQKLWLGCVFPGSDPVPVSALYITVCGKTNDSNEGHAGEDEDDDEWRTVNDPRNPRYLEPIWDV